MTTEERIDKSIRDRIEYLIHHAETNLKDSDPDTYDFVHKYALEFAMNMDYSQEPIFWIEKL